MSGIVEKVYDMLAVESDSILENTFACQFYSFYFSLCYLFYILYILKFISYKKIRINRV